MDQPRQQHNTSTSIHGHTISEAATGNSLHQSALNLLDLCGSHGSVVDLDIQFFLRLRQFASMSDQTIDGGRPPGSRFQKIGTLPQELWYILSQGKAMHCRACGSSLL